MITDLTVGHPKHTLWRFLLPMFISVMFQQLYNIADSSIAGRFAGEDALAAVGASYPITVIFMAFAVGSNLGGVRGGVQAFWRKGHWENEIRCLHCIHCLRSHEFNTHRAGICVLRQHDASDTYPVQYIRRWGAVP